MTYKIICPVRNNQIVVTLPPDFTDKGQVLVVVNDQVETKAQKLELLKTASKDPLFLSDIKEIQDDFDALDNERL